MTPSRTLNFSRLKRKLRVLRTRIRRLSGTHLADAPVTKIVAIALVKNEQDIIEPFLRHNRRFVDAMIILDHMSSDDTEKIVHRCAQELGGIFFADIPVFEHDHGKFMTLALHKVQTAFFADTVCLLDADEFIGCGDRPEFERLLDTVPPGECVDMPWMTFLPDPDAASVKDPLLRMNCRRKEELPPESKSFVRLHGQVDPFLKVGRGNHWLWSSDGEQVPRHRKDGLVLKHLPVRSMDQLRIKGVVGWLANLARSPSASRDQSAWQKRRVFELVINGRFTDEQSVLGHEAMTYAQTMAPERFRDNATEERLGIAPDRKYSDGSFGDPVVLISTAWASSLAQRGRDGIGTISVAEQIAAAASALGRDVPKLDTGLDVTPLKHLAKVLQPHSIIDFGCGDGAALHMMLEWSGGSGLGVDAHALEKTILAKERFVQADLRAVFDAGRSFDLSVCLNPSEALSSVELQNLFDTICRHSEKAILIAVPRESQTFADDTDSQAMMSVLEDFGRRGWAPDLIETLGIRSLCASLRLRRDLVLLKPSETDPDLVAAKELIRIASYPFRRVRELPGVREASMLEPIVFPPAGYGARLIRARSSTRPEKT